jgi:hypothetical protein
MMAFCGPCHACHFISLECVSKVTLLKGFVTMTSNVARSLPSEVVRSKFNFLLDFLSDWKRLVYTKDNFML